MVVASAAGLGAEPWFTDGTPGGTVNLADIAAGSATSIPTEVVYAGGWRYAVTRPLNGEFFVLPPTRDPFTLTPVAADGTRGETMETGEVDGDLVYLPCNAAVRPTPFAPWLLAPFVWMCVHGRRRRAA